MQPRTALAFVSVIGCVDAEPTTATLELSPSDLSVTVVNGRPVIQPFTATLVASDGSREDVTDEATFALADAAFGQWRGPDLELTGVALGPTQARATVGDATATATLTVSARNDHYDAGVPARAHQMFESALVAPACAPSIEYPAVNTVVPANFGNLEVHWRDTHDDLFEVTLSSAYLDIHLYTRGVDANAPFYANVPAAEWERISQQPGTVELSISGVVERSPTVKCTSAARTISVTRQPLAGGLYFWSPNTGIQRQNMAQPTVAPEVVFSPTVWGLGTVQLQVPEQASECYGCALSRDGARLAVSAHDVGYGTIYDFTRHATIVPMNDDGPIAWSSATFTLDGTKLIAAHDGGISLFADTGTKLASVPAAPNAEALDPQLSADGKILVHVESTGNSPYHGSRLVTRAYAGIGIGPAREVLPLVAGVSITEPAWSPDGDWIAYTRTTGWGTFDVRSSLWVVRADGSDAPLQLTAEVTDHIAAHWAPDHYSVVGSSERMFYVAYSASRAYGASEASEAQMWLQPFYPDRSLHKTGAPLRMPFQPRLENRITDWAAALVR